MSNSDAPRPNRPGKTIVIAHSVASAWSALRRFWTNRRRPLSGAKTVYYSEIKSLTAEEWRKAFADDPATAVRWVYAAATHGEIQAQLVWGQMLLDGYHTGRDPDGAFRWFSIAAKSGRADAINMVGRCHERGWGVPVDFAKAAALYAEAAQRSYDWAKFNLACLMLEGNGVSRDPDRAFGLFMEAVQNGHGKSLNMVGHCYEYGLGCERDMTAAADWYRQSAHAGDFRGQHRYGHLLLEMQRVDEAAVWFRRAIASAPPVHRDEMIAELGRHTDPRLRNIVSPDLTGAAHR